MKDCKTWVHVAVAEDMMRRAVEQMPKDYPLGSNVWWMHGRHHREGRIVEHHPQFLHIKVETPTGARSWLELKRVVQMVPAGA